MWLVRDADRGVGPVLVWDPRRPCWRSRQLLLVGRITGAKRGGRCRRSGAIGVSDLLSAISEVMVPTVHGACSQGRAGWVRICVILSAFVLFTAGCGGSHAQSAARRPTTPRRALPSMNVNVCIRGWNARSNRLRRLAAMYARVNRRAKLHATAYVEVKPATERCYITVYSPFMHEAFTAAFAGRQFTFVGGGPGQTGSPPERGLRKRVRGDGTIIQ